MRLPRAMSLAVLGAALSAPALAAPDAADSGNHDASCILGDTIRESDVTLLFDYLRSALDAAAQGREAPPPPPEFKARAEALAQELKARGTLAALLLLSTLEEQAKALARPDKTPPAPALPPPVSPLTPVSRL